MENIIFNSIDEKNKKRIKNDNHELIIEIAPESLENTILTETGVKNILSTMYSRSLVMVQTSVYM